MTRKKWPLNITPRQVAKGHATAQGARTVAIRFDEDTFEEIRERAIANGTSFAEQARQLIEWGLVDAEAARE